MKKTLLFALALIAVGCSDPPSDTQGGSGPAEPIPRNLDGLVQQGDTYLDRETMRPYSGPVFTLAPDDTTQVALSANLKDGKLDGPYEDYHDNGQLGETGTYVAGELDGPAEAVAVDTILARFACGHHISRAAPEVLGAKIEENHDR